eukprot:293861_1
MHFHGAASNISDITNTDNSQHDHFSTSNHTHSRIRRISHPLPPSHEHTNAKAPILPFTNHGSTHTHLLPPAIPSHTNDPYTRLRDLNKENNNTIKRLQKQKSK